MKASSTAGRLRCSPRRTTRGASSPRSHRRSTRLDVERGSDGVLAISDTDTAAAQAQLDSFIEKWKTEEVDTVIILGETTSAKQFVEKIKAEMPDVQLVADHPRSSDRVAISCAPGRPRIRTTA